jgi:pSer/pThr/pTyr-binding forkhead associated (FHA) protein
MLNITRKLARGPRPSLGRLDFDDGAAYELECDYVIGVEPALHQLVREGKAEPIALTDTQNLISRRHAAIRLEGWDVRVVDLGSRNYTFVRIPPGNDPMRLKTDESAVLKPGARVTVGDRSFVFFSHHQLG